jgi:hypothetical protein
MTRMPPVPSDEDLLDAGGWDPRFARVLAKAVVGDMAIAILDTNGADGGTTYEDTEVYQWDRQDGWSSVIEHGGAGVGWMVGIVYASDQAPGEGSVIVQFRDQRRHVPVQTDGWWLFATEGDAAEIDDEREPRRVE